MRRFKKLSPLVAPFKNDNISIYAAAAVFYLCLSFIPSLMLIYSVMPKIISAGSLHKMPIADVIPEPFHPVVYYLLEKLYDKPSIAFLSVSALTGLWSASKGVLSLMDGMNITLGASVKIGYIKRHLSAVLYFIILSGCLGLILLLLVFAEIFQHFLLHYFPAAGQILSVLFHFRGLAALLLLTPLFTLVYRLLPLEKFSLIRCIQCAVLTAAGWVLFSFGFSVYVNHITNIGRFYGSIGLFLLAGIWLRICISLLLYGALYLKATEKQNYRPFKIIKQFFKR